jgi:DNA polymerase III subunit gamma/tau
MSYQVLARKWRPRNFTEMVGQEHVLKALINGLDNDRLHHAYLFTGTRGVGKTTLARILAKCLNCEESVRSEPCGVCPSCKEIAEGRFVDLIEVDAASRTKVEDTRELLENVQYLPTRGRYKVYLIDEVHMLTNHSFNALLKTLEEPPPHVKFLLATTDPQKLPVTVLSRCLQFNLKNLGPERIVGHLKHVLGQEKIPFEESALWSLGRAADGSMRDALSLTDQAIAHGGGTLTAAEVNAMLGTIDRAAVVDICRAIADDDIHGTMAHVEQLSEHSPDYGAALADMLAFWHQVAIAQAMPDALDKTLEHYDTVLDLAQRLSREDVQLYYQMCLLGRKDLPHAADPRSGFEMVLLRLMAFKPRLPDQGADTPSVVGQGSEAAVHVKKPETASADLQSPPVKKSDPDPVPESVQVVEKAELTTSVAEQDQQPQARQKSIKPTLHVVTDVVSEPATPKADVNPQARIDRVSLDALTPLNWYSVCQGLGNGGLVQNLAADMVVVGVENSTVQLCLDRDNSALYNDGLGQRLGETLSDYFDTPVSVQVTIDQVTTETPRMTANRLREERRLRAVEQLKADPHVQFLIREFGGELVESTVKAKE